MSVFVQPTVYMGRLGVSTLANTYFNRSNTSFENYKNRLSMSENAQNKDLEKRGTSTGLVLIIWGSKVETSSGDSVLEVLDFVHFHFSFHFQFILFVVCLTFCMFLIVFGFALCCFMIIRLFSMVKAVIV